MGNPAGSFIWYELMTPDPDTATTFYAAVVGWRISPPDARRTDGKDYRMIGRSDGLHAGGVLKITPDMGAVPPVWLAYIGVPNVDATVAAIAADGGAVHLPPMSIPVGRIAMVTDPQGVPFYVMTPVPPPGVPDATSDVFDRSAPQRVNWNELTSSDLAASKAFYAKHFGFEFNETMDMGPMGDYCFIDHGGETIGAMMQKPEQVPVGMWNFYIRVPAIDAAVAKVNELGGQVFNGPMEVPGGDWIINGMDPQGAPFSLVAKER